MDKLHHEIASPEGWATAWIERTFEPLNYYVLGVAVFLGFAALFVQLRASIYIRRTVKELEANPSNRASIFAELHKKAFKTSASSLKIALVYMLNTIILTLVDSGICVFVLYSDVKEHPEVWDKDMIIAVGLYIVWLFVLFVASFVLVPMLQMLAVTWALTRFSRKNTLSEYVPQARSASSTMALTWASVCFFIAWGWSIGGGTEASTLRFFILEASWGSALAWLEAAFMFHYMSDRIGDKELTNGNGVGEIVSLFAKAATSSFKKSKTDTLPRYEEGSQEEPLLEKS